jgi:photosystem II stability/assembly factor-like uncharacterized protein
MKRTSLIRSLAFVFLLSAISMTGCKKEEPNPEPQPQEVILSDETRILDANTLALISQVDTSDYTITFSGSTAQIEALKAGDIVVSGVHGLAPYGFMRRIVTVNKNGGATTLLTHPALLNEVLLQGTVSGKHEKMGYAQIKSFRTEDGVMLMQPKSTDFLGFNLSFEKPLGSNAKAYGFLYFEMSFNFALDVSFPADVDYFKASIEVEQKGVIGVKANGSWSGSKIKIASVEFTPWTLMVGPLPLVFVPQASLILDAKAGQVTATIETYASEEFTRELGLKYNGDNWSLINQWEPAPTADIMWPALEGDASFEVDCGPRVALKLYGAAGPYFDLLAYSTIDATVSNTNYNLVFTIGLEANAGVEVSAFGFTLLDYSKNLFRKEIKRLTLNNEPLPAGLRITSPPDGALLISGNSVEVQATVSGQPTGGVKFFLDGTLLHTDPDAPYGFVWNITQPKGTHVLKATAEVGGETLTHEVTITIGSGTWTKVSLGNAVNEGEELTAVYFISDKEGWITGKKSGFSTGYGFVLHTTNGGISWQRQAVFPSAGGFANGYAYDILMLGPQYGMIAGQFDGGIMQTNNGSNWTLRQEFWTPDSLNSWLPWPIGVAASKNGAILLFEEYSISLSTDGGITWYDANSIEVNPYLGGTIQKIAFGSGSNGYMATYDAVEGSRVYHTTNNGFTWQECALPAIANRFSVRDVAAFGSSQGWLVGYSHQGEEEDIILFTTNGGQTWQNANIVMPAGLPRFNLESVWFVDELSGFAAGDVVDMSGVKTGILYTEDGGQNWAESPVAAGAPYGSIRDMFFHGSANGFAVGYTENATTYAKEPLLLKYSVNKK